MNKKVSSIIAGGLAGIIILGSILLPSGVAVALSKNETVYAKLNTDGKVKYTTVTEQLTGLSAGDIKDSSKLKDVENLNGTESFVSNGENITWKSEGKEIYYSGRSVDTLPISLDVQYYLNGEQKTAEEIKGKAGEVEIRFRYKNLAKVGNFYTPFVIAMTTTFDEEKTENLTVSNGKVASNGRNLMVAALATPGLYESLGIDALKGGDEVTIKYKTSEVALGDVYAVVTPKIIEKADIDKFMNFDDIYKKADQLAEGSSKLTKGAEGLTTGILAIRDGVKNAQQQLEKQGDVLTKEQILMIKTAAENEAEKTVKKREDEIKSQARAGVDCQPESSEFIQGVSVLTTEQMAAMGLSPDLPTLGVSTIVACNAAKEVAAKVAFSSALETAKTTAGTTAEQIAKTVAESVRTKTGEVVLEAFNKLLSGLNQVAAGSEELKTGMLKFDQEGIKPLVQLVNGDFKTATQKVKRLSELAEEYQNFGGKRDEDTGKTKFILMIERTK